LELNVSGSTPFNGYLREFLAEVQAPIFLQQDFFNRVSYKTLLEFVMKWTVISLN